MHRHLKRILPYIALCAIIASFVVFFVPFTDFPIGDDPGYHATVLRYMNETGKFHFELPYFPQLQETFGNGRFVTNSILVSVTKVLNLNNTLLLPTYFAIFCMAATLALVFFISKEWLKSDIAALWSTAILAFSKWFQANFWEGSYDQYTGLLILSGMIFILLRWYRTKRLLLLLASSFLLLLLYKTHELGFLVGFSIFLPTVFFVYRTKIRKRYSFALLFGAVILIGLFYFIAQPGYFTPNSSGYPIPSLLSSGEGTPPILFALFIVSGLLLIFSKKTVPIAIWFFSAFIFSQSMILESTFYPYRFNVYFIQVLAVVSGLVVLAFIKIAFSEGSSIRRLLLMVGIPIILLFSLKGEFVYTYGLASWLSSQSNNPASVILKEDVQAYQWISGITSGQDIILVPFKWGYYLPAIAGRSVVLDEAVGGDSRDGRYPYAQKAKELYATSSTDKAFSLAKELGVTYIIWDASISRYPERYPDYQKEKFNNNSFFEEVYDEQTVTIYKVK